LFDEHHVSVVRPGIDPRPFQSALPPADRDRVRAEFGASPDEWLVGTVACLKPQKAPEDFVTVAKRVCEAFPRARFVLIGDGELRSSIEALVEQYGLKNRVHLAGWRRDIPTAMKTFDVFLLTSRWEGLPRVLLEARAAGIPVVATKVGGVEEVIVEGRHGWLSVAGDISTLSEGVARTLRERGVHSAGGVGFSETLPKEFHLEEMVKQYESLYDRLLIDQQGSTVPRPRGRHPNPTQEETIVNVPLLDLKAQYRAIRAEVLEAIAMVCDEQGFVLGPRVSAFEGAIAKYVGSTHAIGCASGSDALLLALMAMGVKAGDEVITVPFTFFATAGAISRLGAKPVFVDIQPDTFNIDPEQVARALTPRTRAIIPVHLFGQCADMAALIQLARQKHVRVIEDACQAIGATQQGNEPASSGTRLFQLFPDQEPRRVW
jgi:hypothetical protein